MKRQPRGRPDPLERRIELALSPGTFIRDQECFSFVSRLEAVAARIGELTSTDPVRATALCETFLAGCYERAGLAAEWEETVRQVRSCHHRKTGFISRFELVAAGSGQGRQPSFLERAKARWGGRLSRED